MNPLILYSNKLLTCTLAASGTYSGYDVQNVLDYRPYTFWKAAAGGSNWVKGYWAAAQAVDCVGIVGHNLNSVGASIYVESSIDGTTWTVATQTTPSNDYAIMFSFASQTKQYWRLRIENTVGIPYLGVLMFGSALQFEQPPDAPLTPKNVKLVGETAISETGNLLGANVKFNQLEISHTWQNKVTATWYTNSFEPFMENHAELLKPFFYAWDLTNRAGDIYFVRLREDNLRSDPISRLDYIDTLTLNLIGRK